jgi:hypothetical protein
MKKIVTFTDHTLGLYTQDQINKDWNVPKRIMGVKSNRAEVVVDPMNSGQNVLRIKYPKGKVGQEEDGGGVQWRFRLGESFNKCTVEYRVMFPLGFDFVRGGKLPGLCGGTSPAGGKKSDGSDGFSARVMWRERGEIFQYMYWMERSPEMNWGEFLSWTDIHGDKKPFQFIPGQWHILKTEITLNTPGLRDGQIISWFDGKLALSQAGAFRAHGATFGIDNFNFTTFFGGNTPDWAPTKNEVAYFADFSIES